MWRSIEWDLLGSPGQLIYIQDESEMKAVQTILDIIWKSTYSEALFDEMTGGKYTDFMVHMVEDYIDNAKMLKPTLISVDINKTDFKVYYNEAMQAWLFGLNNSSLILCCTIIEDILKTKLSDIDINLVIDIEKNGKQVIGWKNRELEKLINIAFDHKIIGLNERKIAHKLRALRNAAIHRLKTLNSSEVYKAILDTKEIIEKIFSQSDSI